MNYVELKLSLQFLSLQKILVLIELCRIEMFQGQKRVVLVGVLIELCRIEIRMRVRPVRAVAVLIELCRIEIVNPSKQHRNGRES